MSKKYTAAEMKQVLRDLLCGAFEHMEAIKTELKKLGSVEELKQDPNKESRAKVLTMTLICINDIIHPAHNLCFSLFGTDHKEMLDMYVRNHKVAIEQKIVPLCQCTACRHLNKKVDDLDVSV